MAGVVGWMCGSFVFEMRCESCEATGYFGASELVALSLLLGNTWELGEFGAKLLMTSLLKVVVSEWAGACPVLLIAPGPCASLGSQNHHSTSRYSHQPSWCLVFGLVSLAGPLTMLLQLELSNNY